MAEKDSHDEDNPTRKERFPRREYYRGDVDQPAQYHVLQCSNSHGHHAPLGMYDRRKGCGRYFINYTAKHWGTNAVRWQSNCPSCGRRQQRSRAHIHATFDTRKEAASLEAHLNDQIQQDKMAAQIKRQWDDEGTINWSDWEQYIYYLWHGLWDGGFAPHEWLREASYIHEMLDCTPEDVEPELARYRAYWDKQADEADKEMTYLVESGLFAELMNDE